MGRCVAVLAAGVLAACALFPLGEADCRVADWRQRGYDHGYAGHLSQDMRLASECRERFGVEVNVDAYLAGWRDGYDEWYRLMGSFDRRRF